MKTFNDLKFQQDYIASDRYALEFFHNGYGISVLKTSDDELYNCAVLKGTKRNYHFNYKTPITDNVLSYCTPEMVTAIMRKIQELSVYY